MITKRWSFDNYSCPKENYVEVKETDVGHELKVVCSGEEVFNFSTCRDQWGLFIDTKEWGVAQEDGTASFIEALVAGLNELKTNTIPAPPIFTESSV